MEYRKDCQFKRYDVDDVITFCHANYKYFMMSQTRHWSKWKGLVMKNRKLPSACTRNWKKQHTLFLQHFPFDKNDFHTYLYWETFSFLSLSWLWDWQMLQVELFGQQQKRWAKLWCERSKAAVIKWSEIVQDSKLSPDTTDRPRINSRTTAGTTG